MGGKQFCSYSVLVNGVKTLPTISIVSVLQTILDFVSYLTLSSWKRPSSWRPNSDLFQLSWYLCNPYYYKLYYSFQETAEVEKFRGTNKIWQGGIEIHSSSPNCKFWSHRWLEPLCSECTVCAWMCWFWLSWDEIWINLCGFSWKGTSDHHPCLPLRSGFALCCTMPVLWSTGIS